MRRPVPPTVPSPRAGGLSASPHPLAGVRGEFVWEGKYDARGRRNEPVLPAEAPCPEPREAWGAPLDGAGGGNLLLSGDNLLALAALLPEYRGRVQLIYLDPPFDTGTDHTMRVPVGSGNGHRQRNAAAGATGKRHLELVAFRDTWGPGAGSYLQRMYERLVLMRELLRPSGVLFLHCDWRSSAALRLVLDEVFGPERFVNEIVWHYYNKYSAGARRLPRAHDTILVYARGPRPAIQALRLPREAPSRQLVRENVDGVLRNARDAQGRLRYRTVHDRKADDVWRIPQLQPASAEWSGYATQKHHALLERILALASRPGDLVADFFCGAGTTLAVAERMGRRWIGCELNALGLHTTRKRLLLARADSVGATSPDAASPDAAPPDGPAADGPAIDGPAVDGPAVDGAVVDGPADDGTAVDSAAPFTVASLAPAARRLWYAREFGGDATACRRALLQALGAEPDEAALRGDPADGSRPLGWLEGAACALPELDAPCSAEHALAAARLAERAGAARLYVLAWEFDPRFWSRLAGWKGNARIEVVPLLMPEALVAPAGSAPPVFRGLPRVEMEALPASANGNRRRGQVLCLKAYHPGPARPAWALLWDAPPPPAEPLAWLDGWSVDPAWQPGRPFRHAWWDFRTPHRRELAERSAVLPRNGGRPCVLTADVWGLATLHAPETSARPGRRGPRAER